MRVLQIFRTMLVLSTRAWTMGVAAGWAGLVPADVALLLGIASTIGVGFASLGCLLTQIARAAPGTRGAAYG